ncbi:hypothetical protein WA026_013740 [Henosepilachna vigintioctopunctata]|uniref:Ubiquinone biosynthesis protein COQ4 homolog, mitochondrial n=1 Tax=Henosepilachna vigintioctopunctata TaxID=420089 RepID=A0AAW1UST0_9CUCU
MFKLCRLFKLKKKSIRSNIGIRSSYSTATEKDETFEEYFEKHHIPISNFQRLLLSVGSAATAIIDPYRADMVACLGETTGFLALEYMCSQMEKSEEGSQILKEKPRINTNTINLEILRSMPHNTLAKCYLNFLEENKVTPDSRDPVRFVDDVKLAYVLQRYREIHDFAHALLGMNISILGEITIKWFEAVQNRLPMCYLGALMGPFLLNSKERNDLSKYYLPWAIETGMNSAFLMNIYFENRWDQPIDELRKELNINPLILPKSS